MSACPATARAKHHTVLRSTPDSKPSPPQNPCPCGSRRRHFKTSGAVSTFYLGHPFPIRGLCRDPCCPAFKGGLGREGTQYTQSQNQDKLQNNRKPTGTLEGQTHVTDDRYKPQTNITPGTGTPGSWNAVPSPQCSPRLVAGVFSLSPQSHPLVQPPS